MTFDTARLLSSDIFNCDRGPVLVIARSLPDVFATYKGEVAYFGSTPPGAVDACDFEMHLRAEVGDLQEALERFSDRWERRFAFVYIDHHHAIEAIVAQINAALKVTAPTAAFLLPGAAPPSLGMAGPAPTQPWWVGEVWTLASILRPDSARFQMHVAASEPVGLMLATGFAPIDPAEAIAQASRAHREVLDETAFKARAPRASTTAFLEVIGGLLGEQRDEHWMRVIVDPSEPDVVSSQTLDEPVIWERRPAEFLVDLSDGVHDTSRLLDTTQQMHGTRLDTFEDVTILGRDVLIVGGGEARHGRFYCHNILPHVASSIVDTLAREGDWRARAFAKNPDPSFRLVTDEGKVFVDRADLGAAESLAHNVFLATPDEPDNWGMWLLYNVPGVAHYQRTRDVDTRFLCYLRQSWQRPLLHALGVADDDIIEQKLEQSYVAPRLTLMRQTHRDLALSQTDAEAFDALSDLYAEALPQRPERIFVSRLSRTKGGAYRGLINEEPLLTAVSALGFTVVEPELLPFAQQVSLFRSAKVVAGLGGAGLFNVAFCRPGARVVTIESGMGFVGSHINLFASRGCEYGVVLGREDPDDPRLVQRRWMVDVDPIVAALRDFM